MIKTNEIIQFGILGKKFQNSLKEIEKQNEIKLKLIYKKDRIKISVKRRNKNGVK